MIADWTIHVWALFAAIALGWGITSLVVWVRKKVTR